MKTHQKRKGYTIEEMDKRMAKRIKESTKRVALKLGILANRNTKIKVR